MSWKIIAIVFMAIALAELIIFAGVFALGYQQAELQRDCAYEICKDNPSYSFSDNVCRCYDKNSNVVIEEVLDG